MQTSLVPVSRSEPRAAFTTARDRVEIAASVRRRSKLILCVDDDSNILEIVKHCLGDVGYPVLVSRDADTALSLLARYEPRVILLDVEMPTLNGFQTLTEIHARFPTLPTKVVFLTARRGLDDVRAAQELGADDYLIKPFTRGNLVRRLDRWSGI